MPKKPLTRISFDISKILEKDKETEIVVCNPGKVLCGLSVYGAKYFQFHSGLCILMALDKDRFIQISHPSYYKIEVKIYSKTKGEIVTADFGINSLDDYSEGKFSNTEMWKKYSLTMDKTVENIARWIDIHR